MSKRFAALIAAFAIASTPVSAATIGVSMALFDDNFLTAVRQAMADHAKAQPDVQIQFQDAQGDVGRQLSQVQNFVSQKVDAIIVVPVDTSATRRITTTATQAGIPLVYVNRKPDETSLPPKVAVVASDDVLAGRLEMTELAKRMGGKGNLVIMLGDLANNSTQGRTAGVKEVLKSYPGITVIEEQSANWERTKAIDLMSNIISKGTKVDGVASNNDEMALGAVIALQQAGIAPRTVAIGGIDATQDALAAMQKGDLAVTVFQNAKGQGTTALDDAVKLTKGEAVTQQHTVPFELVTPDNLRTFLNR